MDHSSLNYVIITYYHLIPIADPHAEVARHKQFFAQRDIKSRIYISEDGINCQMSALDADGQAYCEWMRLRNEFCDIHFKIDPYYEHVFPRTTVKYRQQLVAFDFDACLEKRGEHLSPAAWKAMIDNGSDHLLLDIRNDYEWEVGHFAGAECPPCQTSRDFKKFADELKEKVDATATPIMMYCTGGIRCEFFSALLKETGFTKVYQLDGGVVNYGHQQGSDHWYGKLFVFDDRMTVPVGEDSTPVIGRCHHCGCANDTYYNCANTDCNEIFLCCLECLQKMVGCCQSDCMHAKRLRPYQLSPKPFKKMKNELLK